MEKEKLYKLIIGILLALNLLQLFGFLFAPQPQAPQEGHFENEAVKMLNLDAEQKEKFARFAEEHKEKMKNLYDEQTQLSSAYFNQTSDSLLNRIAQIETEKISATQQHFSDVKNLLNESQVANFEQFKKKALQSILKSHPAPPPERRNDFRD